MIASWPAASGASPGACRSRIVIPGCAVKATESIPPLDTVNAQHNLSPSRAPLIINLAPTGMVPTKSQTPYVPLAPDEIVADALQCIARGAAMVHLHARDKEGIPTEDAGIFSEIIAGIRAHAPQAVLITTTSGRRAQEVERRATPLYLTGAAKPDMASLTLGSMNFSASASVNAPQTITRLAEIMHDHGIKPELEIFDLGMVNMAWRLIDLGLISPPFYFNILLGNPATAQTSLLHLATIVNDLPPDSVWSLAGIGRYQAQANAMGVVMGHGVRVGLEDNLWLDDERAQLARNCDMIDRVLRHAEGLGRPVADLTYVRNRLGLDRG